METWKPDRLLKLLLIWSAVTFIIFWLPAVRGPMDGATYTWGSFGGFRGRGVSGDYWFPLVGSAAAIAFLFLGWRGARGPFPWLLIGWHLVLAAGALNLALTQPEAFRFRGDTLGVDIPLAWAGPLLFGASALLAAVWAVRRRRHPSQAPVPPWTPRNRRLLAIVLALLPVQFVLLRFGEPHGTTDQIGVLLTLAQWALISAAVYPWPVKAPEAAGSPARAMAEG